MANGVIEFGDFSGVDSRSSPLRMPPGKSLRCRNWIRKPGGWLELRKGYTSPTMSTVSATTIHSAVQYERFDGSKSILFGQGTALKSMAMGATGTVSTIGTLSTGDQWNAIYANQKIIFGNGTDEKEWDGTTLRNVGIRAPQGTESSSVSVAYSTASTGSWATTTFTGFQLYMQYYNPQTGQHGNRVAIGSRFTVGTAGGVVVVTNLPNISGIDSEWVKVLGRTSDGGDIPHPFVTSTGALITVGSTASTATFTIPDTDPNLEMPLRNGMPPNFSKIAWALNRAYAIDADEPNAIRFSEAISDAVTGLYMGRPEHSWPSSNKTYFPTGEQARGIHSVDDEAWVWSRNHLAILTEFGGVFSAQGRPVVRWRGTWIGGIAGQRAFAKTRYGPFWVSADKQLLTRGENGPVPASSEYEAALLDQIADDQVGNIEVSYLLDPSEEIDRLYIKGVDGSGSPVIVVHDFKLRSSTSPFGEGSDYLYGGMTTNIFVRLPQQIISLRDTSDKMRLWVGATDGRFYQLEDGDADNAATYQAELVQVFNSGPSLPLLSSIEWFGDKNIQIQVTSDWRTSYTDLVALEPVTAQTDKDARYSMHRVPIEKAAQFMLLRITLNSHHADGTLALSSPVPHVPLETYGRMYLARPEMGATRGVGGRAP